MKKTKLFLSVVLIAGFAGLSSCSKNDATPVLQATIYSNLPADPATSFNPTNGAPIGKTGKFTLFSFSTGAVVANSDSATSKWDIGFNGLTIIVNSGTSGPGTAAALVQDGVFENLKTAPDAGYKTDNVASKSELYGQSGSSNLAIPTTANAPSNNVSVSNGWYSYNISTHVITATAGKVIVVKTAGGKYAKLEILNYYKDAPDSPSMTSLPDYYKFAYVYQPNGSKSF